ncbi:hypothetical protein NQL31_008020 [Lotmaria passim]
MSQRCSSAAKKAFRPPFKTAATVAKGSSGGKKEKPVLESCTLCSAHLLDDAAPSPCCEDLSQRDAASDGVRQICDEAACTKSKQNKTFLVPPSRGNVLAFESSGEGPLEVSFCSSSQSSKTAAATSQCTPPGNKDEKSAMVGATLYWVGAAQKAVRYLADTLTDGDVERVLAELCMDPLSVLYSVDEGDFVQP